MKRGFIFSAKHNFPEAEHPIIFWKNVNKYEFIGLMITHSLGYGNVDLSDDSYFHEKLCDFGNTCMVQALLLKPTDWLDNPIKKGQLSENGIRHMEKGTGELNPI